MFVGKLSIILALDRVGLVLLGSYFGPLNP